MSFKVQDLVWMHYPGVGSELSLALALARYAQEDGSRIFPSVATLQQLTRQASRRTIQSHLARMRKGGFLVVVAGGMGGRSKTTRYRIDLDWLKGRPIVAHFAASKERSAEYATSETAQPGTERAQSTARKGAVAVAPEQSLNHQEQSEQQHLKHRFGPGDAKKRPQRLPTDFAIDDALRTFAVEHDIERLEEKFAVWVRWAKNANGVYDWQAHVRHALISWLFTELDRATPAVDLEEVARSFAAGAR